jgi:hypothetical protein
MPELCPDRINSGEVGVTAFACPIRATRSHMRQRLAPMLYDDTEKQAADALRASVVAKAERSPAAVTKQTTGRTDDGLPVHSFQTLLADLATITRNTVVTAIAPDAPFTITTRPTPIHKKAFNLLGVSCTQ